MLKMKDLMGAVASAGLMTAAGFSLATKGGQLGRAYFEGEANHPSKSVNSDLPGADLSAEASAPVAPALASVLSGSLINPTRPMA